VEEALTLYALANADQMVPRCSAATMPAPPAGRGGAGRGGGNLPVTPVAPFSLAAGVTAPERPNPCTAAPPAQAAPVSWPAGNTPGQQR
jgi:carboxypeptidase Q